jgi:hypothetical protein
MIRPWYRSRLFVLGIPGLLFLLWAWLADPHPPSSLTLTTPAHHLNLDSRQRQLVIQWEDNRTDGFVIGGRRGTAAAGTPSPRLFPPAVGHRTLDFSAPPDRHRVNFLGIAYWFLLLLYLAAWGLLLLVWQRRRSRLLKASASLPP